MSSVLLLLRISLRNIFSHFLNVVIGLIILVGTLFFVMGGSLVGSMDKAMSQSIIGSVAGHLQVYQASSADSPDLYNNWQVPDLDPIPDFSKVKGPILSNPNVKAVVPEGVNTAIVVYGNTVDQILEKLRKAVSPGTREPKEKVESLKAHVRQMVSVIRADMGKLDAVAAKGSFDPDARENLGKASSDAFWKGFDKDPFGHLEFLENKIAYLIPDSDQIFLSYVGTDLDAFAKSFDRMQIVDGQTVPAGHRGMLLSKYVYEEMFKLKSAHRLDQIHEALTEKNKKIAKDPDLQDLVKQNRLETREIVLQLDPLSTKKAVSIIREALGANETDLSKLFSNFLDTDEVDFSDRYKVFNEKLKPLLKDGNPEISDRLDRINGLLTKEQTIFANGGISKLIPAVATWRMPKFITDWRIRRLMCQNLDQAKEITRSLTPAARQEAVSFVQEALGASEADTAKLLSAFFDTNDSNFEARYKVFYGQIAPLVELYRLKPGETLTIKAYTKSGIVEAVNVKVYGTFQFKGLEKSGLAGGLSLMDLMSFRDLYGYVTPEKVAETKSLEKEAGVKFVPRDRAEADLFGGGSSDVQAAQQKHISEAAEMGGAGKVKRVDLTEQVYSPEQIEKGVVMGAAILLKDPTEIKQTMKDLQALSDRQGLGLKVIDWQKASGNLGQFVLVDKIILFFATAIIFVVALVIINNAVVMATLQRVREIGTMRAIGARKRFVLFMVLIETLVLGLVFGTVGATLGSLLMVWLGRSGIPASNEFLYFFFSGPRLYPALSFASLIGAFFVVVAVTCVSALYPAIMATRVSPIEAMASDE